MITKDDCVRSNVAFAEAVVRATNEKIKRIQKMKKVASETAKENLRWLLEGIDGQKFTFTRTTGFAHYDSEGNTIQCSITGVFLSGDDICFIYDDGDTLPISELSSMDILYLEKVAMRAYVEQNKKS